MLLKAWSVGWVSSRKVKGCSVWRQKVFCVCSPYLLTCGSFIFKEFFTSGNIFVSQVSLNPAGTEWFLLQNRAREAPRWGLAVCAEPTSRPRSHGAEICRETHKRVNWVGGTSQHRVQGRKGDTWTAREPAMLGVSSEAQVKEETDGTEWTLVCGNKLLGWSKSFWTAGVCDWGVRGHPGMSGC